MRSLQGAKPRVVNLSSSTEEIGTFTASACGGSEQELTGTEDSYVNHFLIMTSSLDTSTSKLPLAAAKWE